MQYYGWVSAGREFSQIKLKPFPILHSDIDSMLSLSALTVNELKERIAVYLEYLIAMDDVDGQFLSEMYVREVRKGKKEDFVDFCQVLKDRVQRHPRSEDDRDLD